VVVDRGINLRQTVTVEVVRKTKDAVVNISATKTVRQRVSPFGDTDPFWQFFDSGETVDVPASSLGSGFIVHPDGYVVTNHHVIDRARQIQVELTDGRKLPADLISSDAEADLAILKIAPSKTGRGGAPRPFPIIELGDSSDLMIGEPVIAVGNPLGYSHSVSTGIVSAAHRDAPQKASNTNPAPASSATVRAAVHMNYGEATPSHPTTAAWPFRRSYPEFSVFSGFFLLLTSVK
jgi:S1-C subfamily serine protease